MRVIAGKARSQRLVSPDGLETRPTTDRIKETLFNMLQPELADCRFLDLFSGSGAIGIEALSRGALCAVFVENDRRACRCIRQNLTSTGFLEEGRILSVNVRQALRMLQDEPAFDIIFMDPPYRKGWVQLVLQELSAGTLADPHTLIVAEEDLHTDFSFVGETGFSVIREKVYKTNKHVFMRRK